MKKNPKLATGFTLVEVLVVVAIISILITAGVAGLGNLAAGKGTATAIATCESLFEEARTIAVSKRCKARVMIDIDDPTNDNYLRRIIIVHEDTTDPAYDPESATGGPWVLASRGYVMPGGTYFSKTYSTKKDGTALDEELLQLGGNTGAEIKTNYEKKYAYYEFNGEGIFPSAGAGFVIGAGVRPKGQEPRITKASERDFAGFVIWRNGSTSTFRNTNQLEDHAEKDLPATGENF